MSPDEALFWVLFVSILVACGWDFDREFPDRCWYCSRGRAFHYTPDPHFPCKEAE